MSGYVVAFGLGLSVLLWFLIDVLFGVGCSLMVDRMITYT